MTTAPATEPTPAISAGPTPARRVPDATYRLQFNAGFPFDAAAAVVDYLADLGVSDAYASPLFQARSGSTHGYDVCDHRYFNRELGGDEGFVRFSDALLRRGLGLLLDVVPNHMGVHDPLNLWWVDVLENGPASIHATFFDIDWHPVKPELANKVLLPVLDDQYGKVLESGRFRLLHDAGAFWLDCGGLKLPVNPSSYAMILHGRLGELEKAAPDDPDVTELQSIVTAIRHLPATTETDPDRMAERNREKEVIKRRLARLADSAPSVRALIDAAVSDFHGDPADPRSFDRMDQLLNEQAYRPAFWRVAAEEINYRRFFDINDLAAIRVEVPEVFVATHALPFRLLGEGRATGLRIDHPDGLWDPVKYFRQLQEGFVEAMSRTRPAETLTDGAADQLDDWFTSAADAAATGRAAWPLYVVAEKILAEGEPLPPDWACAGTTGYDYLNAVNGLFVDRRHRKQFDQAYEKFTGFAGTFGNLENSTKKMVMLAAMSSEINALAHELERITAGSRRHRDFTLNSLTFAIREVIACLPVYRTYLQGPQAATPRDVQYVERAVAEAKHRNPRTAAAVFNFLRDTLLLRNLDEFAEPARPQLLHFALKFQQVTGPVTAKGVEDSAFYVYYRLVSLNEVGGNPRRFGSTLAAFHRHNADRQRAWPHTMLATSTHDNKRSEDVRARIDVLSEIPDEWRGLINKLKRLAAPYRSPFGDGQCAPDRNDEYLLYQTILGAWPEVEAGRRPLTGDALAEFRGRLHRYMEKACREGQRHTSWINPNAEYEAGVTAFIDRCLEDRPDNPFFHAIAQVLRRCAFFGQFNSLSAQLLKLTSPGVPDIYQGTELWDFSLVDPDNRRPVDYEKRRRLLAELTARQDDPATLAEELLTHSADGRIKLWLTHRALIFRRQHPELFARGGYERVTVVGRKGINVVAYRRAWEESAAIAVAPRLVVRLTNGKEVPPIGTRVWADTWLVLPREAANRRYRDVFTGEELIPREGDAGPGLPLGEVLNRFPVALLERLG